MDDKGHLSRSRASLSLFPISRLFSTQAASLGFQKTAGLLPKSHRHSLTVTDSGRKQILGTCSLSCLVVSKGGGGVIEANKVLTGKNNNTHAQKQKRSTSGSDTVPRKDGQVRASVGLLK